ncbi:MAG: class I SAM-dependent methyltransferase [Alphaproteobacteria bacterium]
MGSFSCANIGSSAAAIFERSLIARRRMRARNSFHKHGFLFRWSKAQIADRLLDINRRFETVLQLGSRCSFVAGEHERLGSAVFTADLCTLPVSDYVARDCYIQASEEFLPVADGSLDAVLSNLNLHSVNDLPGSLVQIRSALKNDGLFMATMLGGETLHGLRKIMSEVEIKLFGGVSPHISPFADKRQMGDLLARAGFALPVVDSDVITVTYDSVFPLFADIRGMGESNAILARNKKPLTKEYFLHVAQAYKDQYAQSDGRIVAHFEVIHLLGWAPDASQQKPLKPGSAQYRLADFLGSSSTGDEETS